MSGEPLCEEGLLQIIIADTIKTTTKTNATKIIIHTSCNQQYNTLKSMIVADSPSELSESVSTSISAAEAPNNDFFSEFFGFFNLEPTEKIVL